MQCFVVVGEFLQRKDFISKFVKDYSVKSYNIQEFENIKIADVRMIQKITKLKLSLNEKRLIVLCGAISTESQNALLKTLEELVDSTYIIFSLDLEYSLAPTILSRCRLVRLSGSNLTESNESVDVSKLKDLLNARSIDLKNALSIINMYFSASTDNLESFKEFIVKLRNILLCSINEGESENYSAQNSYLLLEKLVSYYPLILNNNLNLRFVLDKSFLCLTD